MIVAWFFIVAAAVFFGILAFIADFAPIWIYPRDCWGAKYRNLTRKQFRRLVRRSRGQTDFAARP